MKYSLNGNCTLKELQIIKGCKTLFLKIFWNHFNYQFNMILIIPVHLIFIFELLSLIFSLIICKNGRNDGFYQNQSDSLEELVK